jgi:hypothetical protein
VEKLRKHGFAPEEIRRFVEAELNLHAEGVRAGY